MTNTQAHAKKELEILKKTVKDPIITPFTKEILALCEAVGKSGQKWWVKSLYIISNI